MIVCSECWLSDITFSFAVTPAIASVTESDWDGQGAVDIISRVSGNAKYIH